MQNEMFAYYEVKRTHKKKLLSFQNQLNYDLLKYEFNYSLEHIKQFKELINKPKFSLLKDIDYFTLLKRSIYCFKVNEIKSFLCETTSKLKSI